MGGLGSLQAGLREAQETDAIARPHQTAAAAPRGQERGHLWIARGAAPGKAAEQAKIELDRHDPSVEHEEAYHRRQADPARVAALTNELSENPGAVQLVFLKTSDLTMELSLERIPA